MSFEEDVWINNIISKLKLDLRNKTVLTEIGTGAFSYIGLIAAKANAKKIILWTRDSKYGLGQTNIDQFLVLSSKLGIYGNFEFALNERPKKHIFEADIITNSGFVRPLDTEFISEMNRNAVISYMAESWEFRSSDIDLESCEKQNIKVAGTWENHPDLMVFEQCGELAVKLCHDINFSFINKKITIISGDTFGETIKSAFEKFAGTTIELVSPEEEIKIENTDLIFIADYISGLQILGENGCLKIPNSLTPQIVHLCGEVDLQYATQMNYPIYPKIAGYHHKMTKTLAYLGNEPVIKLHGAGLKVGELLHNNQQSDLIQPILL